MNTVFVNEDIKDIFIVYRTFLYFIELLIGKKNTALPIKYPTVNEVRGGSSSSFFLAGGGDGSTIGFEEGGGILLHHVYTYLEVFCGAPPLQRIHTCERYGQPHRNYALL